MYKKEFLDRKMKNTKKELIKKTNCETNLTYMLARYYSQGYGRFLSPDPGYDYDQLDPMSWNLYSYVRGNPVKHLDPTGKRTWGEAEYRAIYEAAPEGGKAQALEQYGKTQRVMGVIGLKGIKATAGVISKASGIASGFTAPLSVIPVMAEVTGALITINSVSSAVELGADAALVALGEEKIETLGKDGLNMAGSVTFGYLGGKIISFDPNLAKASVNFAFAVNSIVEDRQKELKKNKNLDKPDNQSTSKSTETLSMPLNFSLVPENKGAKTLFKDLPCFQAVSNDPTNNNCGGM